MYAARIYCLFRAPRTQKDDEEAAIDASDAKDRTRKAEEAMNEFVSEHQMIGFSLKLAALPHGFPEELSASGMRLITMSLGIMQSFNGIKKIDIEWPDAWQQVREVGHVWTS